MFRKQSNSHTDRIKGGNGIIKLNQINRYRKNFQQTKNRGESS